MTDLNGNPVPQTLEFRPVKVDAICRVCDKTVAKNGESMVTWFCGSGIYKRVFICQECVHEMHLLCTPQAPSTPQP